jgi:hypothetical protein
MTAHTVSTADVEMGDVACWGDYMAWAAGDSFGGSETRGQLKNLRTGRLQTVARAAAGQEIAWVRGDADQLTYTTQSTKTDSAGIDHYTWAIHLVDLSTKRDRVVDTSTTSGAKEHLPSPSLAWPWLVWDKALTDTSYDIYALNVQSAQKVRVVHSQNVQDAMAQHDSVIWIRVNGRPGRVEGDLMQTDLPALTARQLRGGHRVGRTFARDGIVSFSELGTDGRTTSIWRTTTSAAKPTVVERAEAYNIVAGDGFTAWLQGDDIVIKLVGDAEPRLLVRNAAIIARLYASKDRLAYGSYRLDSSGNVLAESLHYTDVT